MHSLNVFHCTSISPLSTAGVGNLWPSRCCWPQVACSVVRDDGAWNPSMSGVPQVPHLYSRGSFGEQEIAALILQDKTKVEGSTFNMHAVNSEE